MKLYRMILWKNKNGRLKRNWYRTGLENRRRKALRVQILHLPQKWKYRIMVLQEIANFPTLKRYVGSSPTAYANCLEHNKMIK